MLNLHAVRLSFPSDSNIIVGQSHFVKTLEDIYEAMVNAVPGAMFGVAFNEASGPCLTRSDGTDDALRQTAIEITTAIGAGHIFAVVMRGVFPINVLGRIKDVPEVCGIFCATANPVEVIVAETEQGRGILGVVDGSSPRGIETDTDVDVRRDFLRQIGYKR
ncbi:MAG: hypothetical protein JWN34_2971 [Bryobacterales bacterium]|jgi:adenosine/AMP kinase|nr:hypothetical protein [Bryobacterales bacterium]